MRYLKLIYNIALHVMDNNYQENVNRKISTVISENVIKSNHQCVNIIIK